MSRNPDGIDDMPGGFVTSREGRVSRNWPDTPGMAACRVTSREGRVSRNTGTGWLVLGDDRHVPRGTCE